MARHQSFNLFVDSADSQIVLAFVGTGNSAWLCGFLTRLQGYKGFKAGATADETDEIKAESVGHS